ncbi:hypothetical protein GOBAR_DD26818 [Gossypium barbadense]|nr:hypothetical protein GOBAR_DD26818 [Gossypium barbadense]
MAYIYMYQFPEFMVKISSVVCIPTLAVEVSCPISMPLNIAALMQIALLQKESEIPVEELLRRYKKDFSAGGASGDESDYALAFSEDILDSSAMHQNVEAKEEVKSKLEILNPPEGNAVQTISPVFRSQCRLLDAPPETLAASALALHYANVIIVIEKLAASPHLIGNDARDDLYNMLPASVRAALRARLKPYAKSLTSSVFDTELAEDWTEAMAAILEWLAPLAHNMIRWQSERSFEQQSFVSGTNALLVQTLYFANREKTEAAIIEILVGLNYVWRLGRELNAKALQECASKTEQEQEVKNISSLKKGRQLAEGETKAKVFLWKDFEACSTWLNSSAVTHGHVVNIHQKLESDLSEFEVTEIDDMLLKVRDAEFTALELSWMKEKLANSREKICSNIIFNSISSISVTPSSERSLSSF